MRRVQIGGGKGRGKGKMTTEGKDAETKQGPKLLKGEDGDSNVGTEERIGKGTQMEGGASGGSQDREVKKGMYLEGS